MFVWTHFSRIHAAASARVWRLHPHRCDCCIRTGVTVASSWVWRLHSHRCTQVTDIHPTRMWRLHLHGVTIASAWLWRLHLHSVTIASAWLWWLHPYWVRRFHRWHAQPTAEQYNRLQNFGYGLVYNSTVRVRILVFEKNFLNILWRLICNGLPHILTDSPLLSIIL